MNLELLEKYLNEREEARQKLNEIILSQAPIIEQLEAERLPHKKRVYELTRLISTMNYNEKEKLKKIPSLPTKKIGRKPNKRKYKKLLTK